MSVRTIRVDKLYCITKRPYIREEKNMYNRIQAHVLGTMRWAKMGSRKVKANLSKPEIVNVVNIAIRYECDMFVDSCIVRINNVAVLACYPDTVHNQRPSTTALKMGIIEAWNTGLVDGKYFDKPNADRDVISDKFLELIKKYDSKENHLKDILGNISLHCNMEYKGKLSSDNKLVAID